MSYPLTLAIPTYNRSKYLKELLPQILQQYLKQPLGTLEILIVDNASTDDTQAFVTANFKQHFRYIRNPVNVGADRNFLECIKSAEGEYIWLFGDDEVLNPDGIQYVLNALEKKPDLIIAESSLGSSTGFPSYKDLLIHFDVTDPIFPVHHTLITKNVFPKSGFDLDFAISKLETNYSHMYGLVSHLKKSRHIYLLSKSESAFSTRDERAPYADPPTQLEKKLVSLNAYIASQIDYKKLKTNAWLYYNCRPLFNACNSKKLKRLARKIFH